MIATHNDSIDAYLLPFKGPTRRTGYLKTPGCKKTRKLAKTTTAMPHGHRSQHQQLHQQNQEPNLSTGMTDREFAPLARSVQSVAPCNQTEDELPCEILIPDFRCENINRSMQLQQRRHRPHQNIYRDCPICPHQEK